MDKRLGAACGIAAVVVVLASVFLVAPPLVLGVYLFLLWLTSRAAAVQTSEAAVH